MSSTRMFAVLAGLAAGLVGAIVKDPLHDSVIWREYLDTVVLGREEWSDLYRACRELA